LCKNEEESLGEATFDPEVTSVLPAFDSFSLEEALNIAGLDQPKVNHQTDHFQGMRSKVAAVTFMRRAFFLVCLGSLNIV